MVFHFPAAILDWLNIGVSWGLGTDCASSNDSLRVQSELRTMANWPMTALSHSSEFSEFRKSTSVVQAQGLAALRRAVLENSPPSLNQQTLLNAAFLGQSSGKPVHPKVNGLTTGSYANLLVWNWEDPVFWPGHNPLHSLIYSDVQPALKGIMTLGRWRGTVGDLRRSVLCSNEYKTARREATERLNGLLDRAGL
jgi:cytosine/adenosine deaminase-related metal-dependent hydrolase